MSLAERVKSRRIELGFTQTEVAEKVGIAQQSYASIEDGKTKKPRNIIGIAKALKCDPDWLLNGGLNIPKTDFGNRRVPIISYVQAGALAHSEEIFSHDGNFEYVLTDQDWSVNAFALKIEGDSMEPDFKAGDVIIIDPEIYPCPGEFVVASNGGELATFKKYKPISNLNGQEIFELHPLNSDFAIIKSSESDLVIIGTMVEHRIYRRKR